MAEPRVMVVEGDEAARLFHAALFAEAGFSVHAARTAAEALDALAGQRPDLIVLGRAPDRPREELLPSLKSSDLDFVPVLLAGATDALERARAFELGADDCLPHPCEPAELLARARALVRAKERHDRMRSLHHSLESLVVSDAVTALPNRRALLERMDHEIRRARRHGNPLGFALLDLDGFRLLNELYGRAAGDRVLRAVGTSLHASLRASDLAGRYGGDEFGVVLPETPPGGSQLVAERLIRAVARVEVREGVAQLAVTASVGVAWFPAEDVQSMEDLLHAADDALYTAKRSGKNRCTLVRAPPKIALA